MPENEKGPAGLAIVLQGFFYCLPESLLCRYILLAAIVKLTVIFFIVGKILFKNSINAIGKVIGVLAYIYRSPILFDNIG